MPLNLALQASSPYVASLPQPPPHAASVPPPTHDCVWGHDALQRDVHETEPPGLSGDACLDRSTTQCRLGLLTPRSHVENRFNLHSFVNHLDLCCYHFSPANSTAIGLWWSQFKSVPEQRAKVELARLDEAITDIFYTTSPSARAQRWATYPQSVRQDLNTLLAVSEAAMGPLAASVPATCAPLEARDLMTYRDLALGLTQAAARGGRLAETSVGYLLGLNRKLRAHRAQIDVWMLAQVDVAPGPVARFIKTLIAGDVASVNEPDPRNDIGAHAYARQRQDDLAALLFYIGRRGASCMFEPQRGPDLTSIRVHYAAARAAQPIEDKIQARIFPVDTKAGGVWYSGQTFHNASGLDCAGLAASWACRGDAAFDALSPARKEALMRRRMVALDIHPDYTIGNVRHAMATTLMRMSAGVVGDRYVHYADEQTLLKAWRSRQTEWETHRDFALSPAFYASTLAVEAAGIIRTPLAWYRTLWEKQMIAPLFRHRNVRLASEDEQKQLRQWVARIAPHWDPTTQRWRTSSSEQYAHEVMALADVFYQLNQFANRVRMTPYGLPQPAGTALNEPWVAPQQVKGLSASIRTAVCAVAAEFDVRPLNTERMLSEDWLSLTARELAHGHEQSILAFHSTPSFSVEVEAYIALLEAGIREAEMGKIGAYIVSHTHSATFRPVVGKLYEKFLEVIRSPRRDDLLVLPSGVKLLPHHIIDLAFDTYRAGLSTHPWVMGQARENMRERGLPHLPSVLNAEIERLAAPLRKAASKATLRGTQDADFWLGNLPISAPLLKLSRALRDEKFDDVPHYVLKIVRDIMTAVALAKAMGAVYLTPLIAAGRAGSAAVLALPAVANLATRRSTIGWSHTHAYSEMRSGSFNTASEPVVALRGKFLGARGQSNAANYYAKGDETMAGMSLDGWRVERSNSKIWGQLRTSVLRESGATPSFSQTVPQPVFGHDDLEKGSASRAARLAQAQLAMRNQMDGSGQQLGLVGMSGIAADAKLGGQPLIDRETVSAAYQWLFKAVDRSQRNASALIRHHVAIRFLSNVPTRFRIQAFEPAQVQSTLQQCYQTSPLFRSLINWFDAHSSDAGGIDIVFDLSCAYPTIALSHDSSRSTVTLPGNPANQPRVLRELSLSPLTLKESLVQAVVAAITGSIAPVNVALERGLTVLFTNHVLLQSGQSYAPRINAAYYLPTPGPENGALIADDAVAASASIAADCEVEDQYLERLNVLTDTPSVSARYQGRELADFPTVRDVIAFFEKTNFRSTLAQSRAPQRTLPLNSGAFFSRLDAWFEIARMPNDKDLFSAARTFLWQCYSDSLLFRHVVDTAAPRRTIPWRLSALNDESGGAHTSSLRSRYLGLLTPDAQTNRFTSTHVMEPFRRLLDEIVSHLLKDSVGPLQDAFSHRGAKVWMTDTMLWLGGWDVNVRLLGAQAEEENEPSQHRLELLAASARRQARAEDNYIQRWLHAEAAEQGGDVL